MTPLRRLLAGSLALSSIALAAAPTVEAADVATYVVQPGDSIYGIAADQGISATSLMSANDLTVASVILPGQQLTIPGTAAPSTAAGTGGISHTIVWGDPLSGIASTYGVRLSALLDLNGLELTSVILPGQRLDIPAGGIAPAPVAAPAAPAAPPAAATLRHTVVWGDSLSGIASNYGVRLSALLATNGLELTSVIMPGRILELPAGATAPAAPAQTPANSPAPATPSPAAQGASSITHTVVRGDSLSAIASRYGVTLSALLQINGFTVTSLILPGQALALPVGATAPTAPTAATGGGTIAAAAPTGDARIDQVVQYALAQQGKEYAFYTRGPDSFDCSGLTLAAYAQVGISLVHWSAAQATQGTEVDLEHDSIRPGDLIFQQRRDSAVINHVGIAIDATHMVHAIGPGQGVKVSLIPAKSAITTVRRYIGA